MPRSISDGFTALDRNNPAFMNGRIKHHHRHINHGCNNRLQDFLAAPIERLAALQPTEILGDLRMVGECLSLD
ncbi:MULTISPECIES: hypothetical protein [Streptomyces]|uniref:hypothetical protein n=1 Tax=Streptomyces TaxID=1883 RepID=UPI0011096707|nr:MULTISPECIES: hypothetical protein [Streptomyces]